MFRHNALKLEPTDMLEDHYAPGLAARGIALRRPAWNLGAVA
jgi:hypothetical protein